MKAGDAARRGLCAALIALTAAAGAFTTSAASAQESAMARIQRLAQTGDANAQLTMGERFEQGLGISQNYATAAHWYRRAADAGLAAAQHRLGRLLWRGLGVDQDEEAAFGWISAAAKQGDPEALFDLAQLYERGIGTSADQAAAALAYGRAAARDHSDAAVSLAVMYHEGRGVAQDIAQARDLYLGPAEAGNARAQNNLGLIYSRGEGGVEQDYDQAAAWFSKAAEQGLSQALTNLGVMYENGFGVPQSDEKAAELYRLGGRDAAHSLSAAIARAGYVADPRLAPLDMTLPQTQAERDAARRGDPVALLLAAMRAQSDPAAPRSKVAAAMRQAARAGMPSAMTNLGLMYFKGEGVPQDFVYGLGWLIVAASVGFVPATELRDQLSDRMPVGQVNAAQKTAATLWPHP